MVQDLPLYTKSEIGKLSQAGARTVSRWYEGYTVNRGGKTIEYPAWMCQPKNGMYSFVDLIELWFVKRFQEHGVPLHRIRFVYQLMSERLKTIHPFLRKNSWTVVSRTILAADLAGDPDARVNYEVGSGQGFLEQIVLEFGDKVEFDQDDFVSRWFPFGKGGLVEVDPSVCFGYPVVSGTRIPTKSVAGLWKSEGKDFCGTAKAYGISEDQVRAAVKLEAEYHLN